MLIKRETRAILGHLSDVPVRYRLAWVPRIDRRFTEQLKLAARIARSTRAMSVLWVDPGIASRVFFYVPDRRRGRVYMRLLKNASQDGMIEALGVIVRASVTGMLKGGRIGVQVTASATGPRPVRPVIRPAARPVSRRRPPAWLPPPRRRTNSPRRPHHWLGLSVAYTLDGYASGIVGHGVAFAVQAHVHQLWTILVSYHFYPEIRASTNEVSLWLQQNPVTAGLRFHWPIRRFQLGAQLGVAVDYVRKRAKASDGFQTVPDPGDVLVALSSAVYVSLHLGWGLRTFIAAGLRIILNNRQYTVLLPNNQEVPLIKPWPVRPTVTLGLSVDLF